MRYIKNLIDLPVVSIIQPVFTFSVFSLAFWFVASYSEHQKLRQEYVRIALGVLQPAEKLQRPSPAGLRAWAVAIIQDSAPIRLTDAEVKDLINGTSNLEYTAPTITYSTGTTYPASSYDFVSPGGRSEYDIVSPQHSPKLPRAAPNAERR